MYDRKAIQATLSQDAFILVNKKLIKKLGLLPTVFLSVLISKDIYHEQNDDLTEDGFFFETIEKMRAEAGIPPHSQEVCVTKLLEKNIIQTMLRGLPARRHFRILYDNIGTSLAETLNCEIPDTYEKQEDSSSAESRNLLSGNAEYIKTEDKNKSIVSDPSDHNTSNSVVSEPEKKTIKKRTTPLVIIPEDPDKPESLLNKKALFKVPPKPSHPKLTEDMKQTLAYWKGKGFKRSLPGESTNGYADLLNFLQDLFDGILFVGFKDRGVIRKYSVREVKLSIDNFWLAVFDKDYLPFNKGYVENMSLTDFIYNKREAKQDRKSAFLDYLSPPRKVSESPKLTAIDTLPAVTKRLSDWFQETFAVVGIDGNFRKNDLIFTSKSLQKFYEDNKSKLSNMEDHYSGFNIYEPINFLAKQLTRMFDKMLRENDTLYSKFTTEWMKSPKTMEERLPSFLRSERMMS